VNPNPLWITICMWRRYTGSQVHVFLPVKEGSSRNKHKEAVDSNQRFISGYQQQLLGGGGGGHRHIIRIWQNVSGGKRFISLGFRPKILSKRPELRPALFNLHDNQRYCIWSLGWMNAKRFSISSVALRRVLIILICVQCWNSPWVEVLKIFMRVIEKWGDRGGTVVKVLCYKSEGR